MGDQMAILRRERPDDFLTHNGVFKNIDYHRFTRGLDIYSQSNYPTFSAAPRYPIGASLTLVRGFTGRMMIIEQLTGPAGQTYMLRTPRPGEMRLWAAQSVAHGAEGVVHFRWRSARRGAEEYWYGVLDHDDVPRRRYDEFRQEGRELRAIGGEVVGSVVDAEIAAIKDFEAEWVFDHQFLTSEAGVGDAYTALFQAASDLRFNIDFVAPDADLARYEIVFAPQLVMMDDALAGRLRTFVERGGTLIMSAHSALKDRDNAMLAAAPPGDLAGLFGVTVESFQTYQPPSREKNAARFDDGGAVPIRVFAEALAPRTARPIAHWQQDELHGVPAATERQAAKGKAVYYGSLFNAASARLLMARYAAERGIRPLLANLPAEIEVTRRTNGESDFLFLLNHAASPIEVTAGEGFVDVVSGRASAPALTLEPFGYRVLKRPRQR
jgi:beta-galactosidase